MDRDGCERECGRKRGHERSRSRKRDRDRGSVTAELAIALPAVVLVLALCLGALQFAALQVRLQDAAAGAARSSARGEAPTTVVAGARIAVTREGDLVCVVASARAPGAVGALLGFASSARSCALDGGR